MFDDDGAPKVAKLRFFIHNKKHFLFEYAQDGIENQRNTDSEKKGFFWLQKRLLCITNKASLHHKQGFFASQTRLLFTANKASLQIARIWLAEQAAHSACGNKRCGAAISVSTYA